MGKFFEEPGAWCLFKDGISEGPVGASHSSEVLLWRVAMRVREPPLKDFTSQTIFLEQVHRDEGKGPER